MNTKWYIGTLIIILALLGLNQEQTKVANQQIVLQFTDEEMTSETVHENALTTITKKLQTLGIVEIEIIENDDRQLSIRYYSDIDAITIKEILSQDNELSVIYSNSDKLPFDFPEDKLPESYCLIVSDFHQQTDNVLSLNGQLAFELNQDYKRFSNPVVGTQFNNSVLLNQDALVHVAYKVNSASALATDTTSDTIPEVRAGPYFINS